MLTLKCSTRFAKPQYLKKSQCEKHCLYDIAFYKNDPGNMFDPETDKTIRLANESRSKLSDIIKPFDYSKLNNLYDTFVPQKERSVEHIYFSNDLRMGDSPAKPVIPKKVSRIQPTKLAKHLDETLKFNKVSKSMQAFSLLPQNVVKLFKLISDCLKITLDKSWVVLVYQDLKFVLELQLRPAIEDTSINVVTFEKTLKEEMVEDLRYFNSLEKEV
ncbi:hypothetical protein Tco_0218269 [Tanacetum coccineum]